MRIHNLSQNNGNVSRHSCGVKYASHPWNKYRCIQITQGKWIKLYSGLLQGQKVKEDRTQFLPAVSLYQTSEVIWTT